MTISVWRYSHLALAVSSFLFVLLASVTGLILAFEPVSDSVKPYAISNLDEISIAHTIENARKNCDEIIELKVEKGRFVQADVITEDLESAKIYIDPKTGKSLGRVENKDEFFQFVKTLHRSLFMHNVGRFVIALTAFLLFLIAFTGSILVLKRQRKLSKFFSKVVREDNFQFFHVVFGRIWLVPILIVSLTGICIALDDFDVFESPKQNAKINFDTVKTQPKIKSSEFEVFKKTPLSDVVSIEFPFSDDIEDAFTVELRDRKWVVNQFTGEILSEEISAPAKNLVNLSLDLHTGRANVIWAFVLAIAAVNVVFFIYSGFAITLKRRGAKIRNTFTAPEAEFVVLAGSENGSTMRFAKAFHVALLNAGQKSFFAELNDYTKFESARHLIVITATYGNGEAPANAKKALNLVQQIAQPNTIKFSVFGFGSHAYPDFCQFAYDLYNTMSTEQYLEPFLEIRSANDKSVESFSEFVAEWSNKAGIGVDVDPKSAARQPKNLTRFTVVDKTETKTEGAFLVTLKSKKRFESGDLLNIYPANDHRERQYSIGKIGNCIQLSVKRHAFGLGSSFLYGLKVGQTIKGRIVQNPDFHFDERAPQTILVSNGTGIAPFLGMIDEYGTTSECRLYCGFRDQESIAPYKNFLDSAVAAKKLEALHIAYSREPQKAYVKDLLERDATFVSRVIENGGRIMLCGSLSMQRDVLELLSVICENLGSPLSHFQANGQIKMDCY